MARNRKYYYITQLLRIIIIVLGLLVGMNSFLVAKASRTTETQNNSFEHSSFYYYNSSILLSNRDEDLFKGLIAKAQEEETVKVIVGFNLDKPFRSEHMIINQTELLDQRNKIKSRQDLILTELQGTKFNVRRLYNFIPSMAIDGMKKVC